MFGKTSATTTHSSRAIEAEKIRRIRNGSTKRERAQQLVVQAPDVLGGIMLDASASPKHRIDASKILDAFAANGPEGVPAADRFQITINLGATSLTFDKSIAPDPNDVDPFNDIDDTPQGLLAVIATKKERTTAVVSLFERLKEGRPPQIEEPVKQSRRHADQKALIKDVLANGPVPATLVEERGAAHGFTKKQLSYARRQMRIVSFKEVGKSTAAGSGLSHNTSGIPAQRATPSILGSQVTSLTGYRPQRSPYPGSRRCRYPGCASMAPPNQLSELKAGMEASWRLGKEKIDVERRTNWSAAAVRRRH